MCSRVWNDGLGERLRELVERQGDKATVPEAPPPQFQGANMRIVLSLPVQSVAD